MKAKAAVVSTVYLDMIKYTIFIYVRMKPTFK